MAIQVHKEPEGLPMKEVCTICRIPTRYWTMDGQKPCCQQCASEHESV